MEDKAVQGIQYFAASVPVSHQALTVLNMQYWNENSAGIVAMASAAGAVVAIAPYAVRGINAILKAVESSRVKQSSKLDS